MVKPLPQMPVSATRPGMLAVGVPSKSTFWHSGSIIRGAEGCQCVQSLYTGDRSLYRWGKRQPVRRRRGDVHGDLSAIVLHLDWADSGEEPDYLRDRKSATLTALM